MNIMQAIERSIYLQAFGLFRISDRLLAPYPSEKKNTNEAAAAPIPNAIRSSPRYLLEVPPISSKVSTYTCGLRNVKAAAAPIVPLKSPSPSPSVDIPTGFIADFILSNPYPTKNRVAPTAIHFGAALGLAKAVDEICEIGIQEVWEHDLALADKVIEGANRLGLSIVSSITEEERSAIVSLRMPEGVSSEAIARRLQDEYSILVTSRAGLLRVSPHIDNSAEEVGMLFDALEKLLS